MAKTFNKRLAEGKPLIGTILTLPAPSVGEILADIGFDWLFVDAEHSPLSLSDIQGILQATDFHCPCIVRIPANDEVYIKQVLDIGAAGIIAPLVNNAEMARRVVSYAKYPPVGTRSVGIARAHGYGRNLGPYLESANQDTAVIIQVEHVEAAHNIEEILAVPGIDAVFLGPYDLSGSLGKPGAVNDPEVKELIEKVRAACSAKKMPLGIFALGADAAKPYIEQGYSLIVVGTDAVFLAKSAEEALTKLR